MFRPSMYRAPMVLLILVLLLPLLPAAEANHQRPWGEWTTGTTRFCEDELALWATPVIHAQDYLLVDPGTRFQLLLLFFDNERPDATLEYHAVITFYNGAGLALEDHWGAGRIEAQTPTAAVYATACIMDSSGLLMEPTPVGKPATDVRWQYRDGYVS